MKNSFSLIILNIVLVMAWPQKAHSASAISISCNQAVSDISFPMCSLETDGSILGNSLQVLVLASQSFPENVEGMNSEILSIDTYLATPLQARKETQRTALILIATSNLQKPVLVDAYRSLINELSSLGGGWQVGLATISSQFELKKPFATGVEVSFEQVDFEVKELSTLLYQGVIDALKLLEEQPGQEKYLLIFSDDVSEDAAFTKEQVLTRAESAGVEIVSFGQVPKEQSASSKQDLMYLATATGGKYFDLSSSPWPDNMTNYLEDQKSYFEFDLKADNFRGEGSEYYMLVAENDIVLATFQVPADIVIALKPPLSQPDLLSEKYIYMFPLLVIFSLGLITILHLKHSSASKVVFAERDFGVIDEGFGITQASCLANLIPVNNDDSDYAMIRNSITVGPNEGNDLIPVDDTVSLSHSIIFKDKDGIFQIKDLNSTNNVYVNGIDIGSGATQKLENGDLVELGAYTFSLQIVS